MTSWTRNSLIATPLPSQNNTVQKKTITSMPRAVFETAIPVLEPSTTEHILTHERTVIWKNWLMKRNVLEHLNFLVNRLFLPERTSFMRIVTLCRVQLSLEARDRYVHYDRPFLAVLLICSYMQLRLDTPWLKKFECFISGSRVLLVYGCKRQVKNMKSAMHRAWYKPRYTRMYI